MLTPERCIKIDEEVCADARVMCQPTRYPEQPAEVEEEDEPAEVVEEGDDPMALVEVEEEEQPMEEEVMAVDAADG